MNHSHNEFHAMLIITIQKVADCGIFCKHGTCVDSVCKCKPGWTGTKCDKGKKIKLLLLVPVFAEHIRSCMIVVRHFEIESSVT